MDNDTLTSLVKRCLVDSGLALPEGAIERLVAMYALLQKWNAKVNLTRIVEPREVVEKHFIDSLLILPELEGATSFLDVGTGAGFPGLPLKIARPELKATLVDASARKVAFVKQAIVQLQLSGASAVHQTLAGSPEDEGIERADRVVARAVGAPEPMLRLCRPYLTEGGAVLLMLGRTEEEAVQAAAQAQGFRLGSFRVMRLPWSGAERAVALLSPA
ncbi:MAG: 16S rRNA (guanine(527)-N(7))-methyltransferase RsmG [Myxococcaceae bacterium]